MWALQLYAAIASFYGERACANVLGPRCAVRASLPHRMASPFARLQRRRVYEETARTRFSEMSRKHAQAILQRHLPGTTRVSLTQLAHALEMKSFLSHEHCTSLTRYWWSGGYDHEDSTTVHGGPGDFKIFSPLPEDMQGEPLRILRFLIEVSFPPLNPKILFARNASKRSKESSVTLGTADSKYAVFDTMAATLSIIASERQKVDGPSGRTKVPVRRSVDASTPPELPGGQTSSRPPMTLFESQLRTFSMIPETLERQVSDVQVSSAAQLAQLSHLAGERYGRLNAMRRRLVIYYRIPVIKFMVRFISHFANIALVATLLYVVTESESSDAEPSLERRRRNTIQGRFRPIEAVCAYSETSMLADQLYIVVGAGLSATDKQHHVFKSRGRKEDWMYSTRFLLLILATIFRGVSLGIGCERGSSNELSSGEVDACEDAVLRARPYFEAYQTTVILSLTVQGLQSTNFLSIFNRKLGVLIQTLRYMINDLGVFLLLFFSIVGPVMVCYVGFTRMRYYNSVVYEEVGTSIHPRGELFFALWAGLGVPDSDMLDTIGDNSVDQWIANSLSMATVFVSGVVLMNLLIAMFSDVRVGTRTAQSPRATTPSAVLRT